MPKFVNFNVRLVPEGVAKKLMAMAHKAGMPRENYIRKIFELHVEQTARAPKTPGRYVLETPTHEEVANALEADRISADVALDERVELEA